MNELFKFRLQPNSKCPTNDYIKQNQKKSFTKNPISDVYNIGIPTGTLNDIFVVDLDFYDKTKNDELFEFQAADNLFINTFGTNYEQFKTYTVQSANGGIHLYFKYDVELQTTTNAKHHIDIRADGAYIVGAGSKLLINNKLKHYKILYDKPVATIPTKLKEFLLTNLYTIKQKKIVNNVKLPIERHVKYNYHISDIELEHIIDNLDDSYWTDNNKFLQWTSFMKHLNKFDKWDSVNKTKANYDNENNINQFWNTSKIHDSIVDNVLSSIDPLYIDYYKHKPIKKNKISPTQTINKNKLGYDFLKSTISDYIIKSDCGTGKTTSFKKYIQQGNKNFISIVSRVSLGLAQYDTFTIDNITVKFYQYHNGFEQGDNIIITIDSIRKLYRLDLSNYIIFLDEYNSLIEYLHTSDTLNSTRYPIYKKLISCLNKCKQIIASDADINDISIKFYKTLKRPKHEYILNTYQHNNGIKAIELNNIDDLIDKLKKEPKFLLACDSKSSVDIIAHKLNDPDIICITSETNEHIKFDDHSKIIFSPKVLYGIDSTMERPVYCYYKECTISPSNFLQQICRCRNITTLYYCCIKKKFVGSNKTTKGIIDDIYNLNELGIRYFEDDSDSSNLYINYKMLLSEYMYMYECYKTNKFSHFICILDSRGFIRNLNVKYHKNIKADKNYRKELKALKSENFSVDNPIVQKINNYLCIPGDKIMEYKDYFINQALLTNHFNICRYMHNPAEQIEHDLKNTHEFVCNKLKSNKGKLLYLKKLKDSVNTVDIYDIEVKTNISKSRREKLCEEANIVFDPTKKITFNTNDDIKQTMLTIYRQLFGNTIFNKSYTKDENRKTKRTYTINKDVIEQHNELYNYRSTKSLKNMFI